MSCKWLYLRRLEQDKSFFCELNGNLRKNTMCFNYIFMYIKFVKRKSNVVIILTRQRDSRK